MYIIKNLFYYIIFDFFKKQSYKRFLNADETKYEKIIRGGQNLTDEFYLKLIY